MRTRASNDSAATDSRMTGEGRTTVKPQRLDTQDAVTDEQQKLTQKTKQKKDLAAKRSLQTDKGGRDLGLSLARRRVQSIKTMQL